MKPDIEKLLQEWRESDSAGVFRTTPVDRIRRSVDRRAEVPLKQVFWRTVGVAAGLVLAIWGWRMLLPSCDDRNHPGTTLAVRHADELSRCLTGPGIPANPDCLSWDIDRDGDVDLADIGQIQRFEAPGTANPS